MHKQIEGYLEVTFRFFLDQDIHSMIRQDATNYANTFLPKYLLPQVTDHTIYILLFVFDEGMREIFVNCSAGRTFVVDGVVCDYNQ